MRFSRAAAEHVRDLRRHYRLKQRPEAVRNLTIALREAMRLIRPGHGCPAPRPYPELAAPGEVWVHTGRYWVAYRSARPAMIVAVFYDEADIPGRRAS